MSTVAWRFGWVLLALFPSGQYLFYVLGASSFLTLLCFGLDQWVQHYANGPEPAHYLPYLWLAKLFSYFTVGLAVTQSVWLVLAMA